MRLAASAKDLQLQIEVDCGARRRGESGENVSILKKRGGEIEAKGEHE